jgi:hypothetical protein
MPAGTLLVSGLYEITATATDSAGLKTSTTARVTVDNAAPATLAFTTPANAAIVTSLPSVGGTAIDNAGGSGIATVNLSIQRHADKKYWDGTAWSATPATLAATVAGNTWSVNSSLPAGGNLPAGAYILVAQAVDRAGNSLRRSNTIRVAAPAHAAVGGRNTLSTLEATTITQSVALTFFTALDAETATDAAHYRVTVGGVEAAIESVNYDAARRRVTLGLAGESLHGGAHVEVAWDSLRDERGAALSGMATVTAK